MGLARDVADAHKHFELDRSSRQLTNATQTSAGTLGWGKGGFGEGVYGGAEQLVVTLDDGSKRPLLAIMNNVMEMWEDLLQSWNL